MNPDRDFLLDIVDFIETIERHRPEAFEDFVADEVVRTATIHWVQTIGEAASGISEELRSEHPDVPWRQIVDMRNLLAHGYRCGSGHRVGSRDPGPSEAGNSDSADS